MSNFRVEYIVGPASHWSTGPAYSTLAAAIKEAEKRKAKQFPKLTAVRVISGKDKTVQWTG